MNFASNEPPSKRRRFFLESLDSPDVPLSPTLPQQWSPEKNDVAKPSSSPTHPESSVNQQDGLIYSDMRDEVHMNYELTIEASHSTEFDQALFESIIGTAVEPDDMMRLRKASDNKMEAAVNMYFDGSWKENPNDSQISGPLTINESPKKPRSNGNITKAPTSFQQRNKAEPGYRYIGAFGVGAWATKSGTGLVKYGETVKIERQKIMPPKLPAIKDKKGALVPAPVKASRRVDVVVRFTNSRGEEVGRLPRETSDWVSALIDSKVCRFQGTCVYAPDRIRTNDTIFLQLRCSLLDTAFNASEAFKPAENRETTLFEEKETSEEKELRLRQIALIKLFSEINMLPSQSSETNAKHKRERLLQAAELGEKQEAEKAKQGKSTNGAGNYPSDEVEEGKELEQAQLDSLYKKAQSFDFESPEAEPPATFAMDLRRYQKQALYWMLSKEKDEKDESRAGSMHPLWEEYLWPVKDMDDNDLPRVEGQDKFYVNPYSGQMSLEFPMQEQHCLGGILADEMGLGKTIEMMSLIHSHKSDVAIKLEESGSTSKPRTLPRLPIHSNGVERAPCTTLVVAPMSLLAQWQSEAENASVEGTLSTMVYYGNEKAADLRDTCCEANAASAPNVIVTSYGVVLSEFTQIAARGGDRASQGGLFSVNFFRIILDEAHYIKNRQSKTAKACYELAAEHRWALTGTPIVNRLEDLFSLVRFLRVDPWSNFSFWKTFITVPFESKEFVRALDVVQTVLEPLVLRRTKDMKTPSGEALVPLPIKTVEVVEVELSQAEREVYDHIFTRAKRAFAETVEAGTVMKSYTHIFAQILRLRQSCCHPFLTRKLDIVTDELEAGAAADAASGLSNDMDLEALIERFTADTDDARDANVFGAHVLKQIRDEAANECPICTEEPMIEHTVTGCWHSACKKCLQDYITHQTDRGKVPRCFNCREVITSRDLFEVTRDEGNPDSKITLQRVGSHSSAKVSALLAALKQVRRESPETKSVIFSQFVSFLSLIEPELTRAGIPFLRLDGSMVQKARARVLRSFADCAEGTVLLLSLRAGGVGLNLTMARRVYMMDPWWSFAVEAQAIDRVHRMGQTEAVHVSRFIVRGSVEERMLRVQDRKNFIASSLGMQSDEEKKLQRVEDIRELLS